MTNQNFKSSFHEKQKMLLVLLGVFLGSINQVWAGPYMEEPTLGLNSTNRKASALTSLSLGDQTSLVISYIEWYAKKGGGDLWGDGYLVYGISGTTGSTTYWGSGTTDGWRLTSYDWYDSGNTCKTSASPNTELCSNRKPGDYEMYFYFKHRTGSSSAVYYSNNNNNYHVYWTIPEPTITISGFSSLVAGTAASVSASISSYPVGATLTKLEVSGNVASSVNKTGTGTSISSLSFTPNASGSKGITVTVTVKYGTAGTETYAYQYNVSPPAVSDFTITPSGAGYLSSGNGTDDSPYLVTYNGSITFGLSGATKAATDDNSSAQYSTDGTNYGTTGTYISQTHSSVTQTTNQNWKYKARLKNNSAALYGAVKEKTVYWKVPTSTVTLHDNNGGSHNGSATTNHGKTTLSIITKPEKTGYHVDGYYEEAAKTHLIANANGALQTSTSYTDANSKWNSISNQTLYTKWAANTYTIKFSANNAQYAGPAATGTTASIAATYGQSYTLTANGFAKEGYTFNGWNSQTGGGGTNYTDGQTVSNLTSTNNGTKWLYAKWTGLTYTVTFNPKGGTNLNHHDATVTMGALYTAGTGLGGALPTVTPPAGYVFDGWYTAATGGTKITASSKVAIPSDHTLYAHYVEKAQVYFKNTLGWSEVWVAYDATWRDDQGAGNNGKTYRKMTQIAGTDIFYDDIPDDVLSSWKYNIAFNSQQLGSTPTGNYTGYDKGKAVFRRDFDSDATMFVPYPTKDYDKNWTAYYSTDMEVDKDDKDKVTNYRYKNGYWVRYNNVEAGYSLKGSWDNWAADHYIAKETASGTTYTYTIRGLSANTDYTFKLFKHCATSNTYSSQFSNTGTMTSGNCSNWTFNAASTTGNAGIKTTVAGDYTFNFTFGDGEVKLSVEYPVRANDYRVVYTWNDGSDHTYNSEIIRAAAGTNETISVFIHSSSDASSRTLKIAKCTSVNSSGVATWNNNYGTITIPSSIKESGVYNFIITQNGSAAATGAYWNKYTGNYYIRTAASDGGWDMYKYRPDNIMTLSEYSLTQTLSEPYSHYYCRFIESTDIDITYAVATDYSPNISGKLVGDATIGGVNKTKLPASANVRFTYNEKTNALRRAYLKNAQGGGNTRFLVLHGRDSKIFNANGSAIAANPSQSLEANELLFSDLGNWVYQVELDAQPGANVSLIARYNGETPSADRYLIGSSSSGLTIMGGSGTTKYDILAVYDFKTNRLMTVWTPNGAITQALTDVDVLLIRHAQDAGKSITFNGGSLTTKKVYGALEFQYDELVGRVAAWTSSSRPLLKFFISFPFDVNVSDIFGLNSAYGDAYVIEEYDGAERASKGFFRGDGTTTFWKELKAGDVMKANVGYSVIMDNDYLNNDMGHVWDNKSAGSKVYLYFPSVGDVGSIASKSVKITIPEHKCEIDRTFTSEQAGNRELNHKNTDSNWNMMGVPIFDNHSDNGTTGQPGAVFAESGNPWDIGMNYFYEWNPSDNQYAIHTAKNYQFKSMHGYMVQYHGDVTFKTAATPATVAARRAQDMKEYQLELQVLDSDAEVLNRTYVELRENACDTFVLNEDVYMTYNNYAVNVYTLAGNYDVAANVLSVGNHIIPVYVEVNKAGTYTFSMPSNFSGKVTLIDNFTGEHTDLSISDYEVELPKSVIEDRFMLEINIEKVTTAIDGINGEGTLKDGKAHKFLQNGIMYILQNGILYDAQGKRVQ